MKSKFSMEVMRRPWHSNMTDTNHLGKAFLTEPEKFDSVLTRVFSASQYAYNPMIAMTKGAGRSREISSFEWEWDLMGASTRPLISMENVSGTTTPGIGQTEFRIKLDEDWFKPGDTIVPEDKQYLVRISRSPIAEGDGFIYIVRLLTDDQTKFLPVKYLAPGAQWSKLFSVYEEYGAESGSVQYAAPFKLRSQLSTYRKEYTITGDAANSTLVVGLMDAEGKVHRPKWLKYAEAEFWIQWYKEIERGMWYGQKTRSIPGANGRPVMTGPGIQEILQDGHIHYYNKLTTKLIQEYLMDIFYGRVGMESRKIVAYTGEYGMIAFHQAMVNASAPFLTVDTNFIKSAGSGVTSNDLQFGGQFVRYVGANGIELTLVHNPLYDDREINYRMHPEFQVPVESMRFTFLDFGGRGMDSNVQYVSKAGGDKLGYVNGLETPYGPLKGGAAATAKDGYTMIVLKQCGVHIEDPSRCGELILAVQ